MVKDTSQIKENIINFLEKNGPSLPVHIAKRIEMDMIFASAFLSELMSQHRIKTSKMKVGTSPIYFIPGQESGLEKFSEYIKGKEKEAYLLLKEKKFLIDSEQETAIKVALRNIKDFAFDFERGGMLIWRYLTSLESEYSQKETKPSLEKSTPKGVPSLVKIEGKETKEISPTPAKKTPAKKKTTPRKKANEKKNEKFFNTVKEYLREKQIEISDIISFNTKDLTLKVNIENKEKLIVAFNKKRITEADILSAYKKAQDYELEYIILSLGEPAKKTVNLIEAAKRLNSLEKIEQS